MAKEPLYPHVPRRKEVQFPHTGAGKTPTGMLGPGTMVRLKSGTQGWVRGEVVEYFDVIPVPSAGGMTMMFGGGMTPGYKVRMLEGKHKGEVVSVPLNYVERVGGV